MRSSTARLYALVLALSIATLYGSTYQQFRFFTLAEPGGASDAVEYVKIARGDPGVDLDAPHHYRWVVPAVVRLLLPIIDGMVADPELAVVLAFYLVNFSIGIVTCLLLFGVLQALGFSILLSLVGLGAFASSRAIVLTTATPMVDSIYYWAVATVIFLIVTQRTTALVLCLPLLVLSKETILPFLLLPALTATRRSPAFWASLVVAVIVFATSGRVVDAIYMAPGPSLASSVADHFDQVGPSLRALFTPAGLHDLQGGFSLLLPLAIIGAWLNARHHHYFIPPAVTATVPLALGLALLSGNLGRMFFAAFPAVIAYAMITVEHVARAHGPGAPSLAPQSSPSP